MLELTIVFILALFLGLFLGGVFTARMARNRIAAAEQVEHIDYKERWASAVELLGIEGRLTENEIKAITAPAPQMHPAEAVHSVLNTPQIPETFRGMSSYDRRRAEETRAENGLPPLDNLAGMNSFDRRMVLEARAENGTG